MNLELKSSENRFCQYCLLNSSGRSLFRGTTRAVLICYSGHFNDRALELFGSHDRLSDNDHSWLESDEVIMKMEFTSTCPICAKRLPCARLHDHIVAERPEIRREIVELIRARHPDWTYGLACAKAAGNSTGNC